MIEYAPGLSGAEVDVLLGQRVAALPPGATVYGLPPNGRDGMAIDPDPRQVDA